MALASSTHSSSFVVIFAANIKQIIHPTIRFAEFNAVQDHFSASEEKKLALIIFSIDS